MNAFTKVAVRYGIYTTIALIVYFLALRAVGFHENPWLRVLNGIVVTFGIYSAIRDYKEEFLDDFNYAKGFQVGLITGFISTILFSVFMAIYLFHIDPHLKICCLENGFQTPGRAEVF